MDIHKHLWIFIIRIMDIHKEFCPLCHSISIYPGPLKPDNCHGWLLNRQSSTGDYNTKFEAWKWCKLAIIISFVFMAGLAMAVTLPNMDKVVIDGFTRKGRNSSALGMELRPFCIKPWIHRGLERSRGSHECRQTALSTTILYPSIPRRQ